MARIAGELGCRLPKMRHGETDGARLMPVGKTRAVAGMGVDVLRVSVAGRVGCGPQLLTLVQDCADMGRRCRVGRANSASHDRPDIPDGHGKH